MKNKKIFFLLIFLGCMLVAILSVLVECYQYRNICKLFFRAVEEKDVALMDDLFYEYAQFSYQNTIYKVVRDDNLASLNNINYDVRSTKIEEKLVFIDCIQDYASIHFTIEIGSDHTGNENELMGWLHIEKMEDGSYKITEIFIYETNNTKFIEQLFGGVRL